MDAPFRSVAVVGCGLIGGSVARVLRRAGVPLHLIEPDRSVWPSLREALDPLSLGERVQDLPAEPEFVILCAPPTVVRGQLAEIAGRGVPAMDVASVKGPIVAEASRLGMDFTGAHPMRGSDRSGFAASSEKLLVGAPFFLCPAARHEASLVLARRFVGLAGASAYEVVPETHDDLVASTSHLPHLVAAVLAATVLAQRTVPQAFFGAGFMDTTRVSRGDPSLWQSILGENRQAVISALRRYGSALQRASEQIEAGMPVTALEDACRLWEGFGHDPH